MADNDDTNLDKTEATVTLHRGTLDDLMALTHLHRGGEGGHKDILERAMQLLRYTELPSSKPKTKPAGRGGRGRGTS